jgi:HK97 family phage portal protein
MSLTLLNLEQPEIPLMRADGYESSAPTGVSLSDIKGMEQFLIGMRTHTGQVVTPEKARRCTAVLACMRGISEDLSALDLPLYKRGKDGDEIARDHNVHRILNVAPNDIMTPMELREHILYDMMLRGNFYNLINLDDTGAPVSVWPLQADYVCRQWRQLLWTYTDPLTGVSGDFSAAEVWRGTILSGNGLDGVAITLLAREAVGLLLAAEEQAARLFSHGVQTDLTLTTDGDTLDGDAQQQLREAFMQRHSGSGNAWMPLILTGGLKASRIGLTAQESQYMEARNFQMEDIARVFRYPSVLLGSSGKGAKGSTYANAEQFFESYTKHTLLPWATRIEQTIHRDLLTTKEQAKYYAKHDFSSLLQPNESARIGNWNAKIAGGWAQPAEARNAERMPKKPGLEYFSKPAGSTGTVGNPEDPQPSDPTPTDQSGSNDLPRRIAGSILRAEQKALMGNKADVDVFYSRFDGHVQDLTGATPADAHAYLEMRRAIPTIDRFTTESQDAAITALIQLCKGQSNG